MEPKLRRLVIHEDLQSLTEAELDELSLVTPQDVERAKAFVRRASPFAAKLLDSELEEDVAATADS